jgi:hypothetical protein
MSSFQKSTNVLHNQLLQKFDKFMFLKIFITGSNNLKSLYYAAVDRHNNNLFNKDMHHKHYLINMLLNSLFLMFLNFLMFNNQ